jgi:NTE family protein
MNRYFGYDVLVEEHMKNRHHGIGLALGSGGSRGLAHICVLKVLRDRRLPITHIAGSSIGALVGAFYAAWQDVDRIEKLFLSYGRVSTSVKIFDPNFRTGFLGGQKIERLIDDTLEHVQFSDLGLPLTVVATDLHTGVEVDINSGSVAKAVRASIAALPVFSPIERGKQLLADGGLSNPVPDDIARSMGASLVVAVSLDAGPIAQPLKSRSLPAVSLRAVSVIKAHYSRRTTRTADYIIEPTLMSELPVGFEDFFNIDRIRRNIKSDERAALAAIPAIRKLIGHERLTR